MPYDVSLNLTMNLTQVACVTVGVIGVAVVTGVIFGLIFSMRRETK